MQPIKTAITFFALFFPIYSLGISVKINNPKMDLDAKNNLGTPAISVHCNLTVSGIKGKDFDLVAIVQDSHGNWHENSNGSLVKTHFKNHSPYESSVWDDIQVYLPHNKLSPKIGNHTYKVYLYVYYNGDWYGRTYAGSYNLEGKSSSLSDTHTSSHSYSSNKSSQSSSSTTITCNVCAGGGITTCLLCGGTGGSNQYRCLTYPPYTSYYEWVSCMACGGHGKVFCTWCNGTGQVTIEHNHNANGNNYYNGNSSSNYYNNSSGNYSNSTTTTCRICGGSGVCTSCHGKGGEWRDTGYYTGSGNKSWIDCPSCNGSKRCFNCHGTGRQ